MDTKTENSLDLDEVIETFMPDLIHVHNVMNPQVWDALANLPIVTTLHDHRVFCPGQGKWTLDKNPCTSPMARELCAGCFTSPEYYQRIFATTLARQEGLSPFPVTVVSRYMADEVQRVGLSVLRIIPPWVPPPSRSPMKEKPPASIVFVGRLVESKGIWNAAETWKRSESPYPLVFVGTGRERGALERAGFQVTGWLSRDDTLAWIHEAKAVLFLPNWQEPYGMVGPEALALGTPVVAWNSGGIPEWCPQDTLVDYGDIEGATEVLNQVLSHSHEPSAERPTPPMTFSEAWSEAYTTVIQAHRESRKSG
jgi:glycosyltransferase involved in cell wall biosynthesis